MKYVHLCSVFILVMGCQSIVYAQTDTLGHSISSQAKPSQTTSSQTASSQTTSSQTASSQTASSQTASSQITLDMDQVPLRDAIRMIAQFQQLNVVISPAVHGVATLNLHEATPAHAFDLLLTAHGLAKWPIGKIWFIAPLAELIQRKQEELKWQTAWDETLPLKTKFWQIKYGKAEDIAHLIQDEHGAFLSKRGHVRVDQRTNTICIEDVADRLDPLYRLINRLDVPVKQILIEARIASVDSDFERELGINFSVRAVSNINTSDEVITSPMNVYSLAVAKLADGSQLDIKLSALENAGLAELISSPRLFTSNQQAASIEAGEEVPYQEVSRSGGTAIAFKKAVLGLRVTPQILPGNDVLLQLQINQDRPSHAMVNGVPVITTRQVVSSILVKNGETVVLGGIYETSAENGEERIPFINQIPIVGWLLKQKRVRKMKRELLIFVTPKIIT